MNNNQKDRWDKSQIIVSILSSILIPIVIALAGYFINDTIKDREIRLKYIEIAINILSEKPSQDSIGLRLWAIDIVAKYSELKLSDDALEELKRTALPLRKVLQDENGDIITDEKGDPILLE